MKKPKRISEQIRQAIDASGLSRYEIAKQTGLEESTLSRFHHKKMGLSLKAIDEIGTFLGLEITSRKKGR